MLKRSTGSTISDAADDSLNDTVVMEFVTWPRTSRTLVFIYSRVTPIRPDIIEYFKRLNADEVYLGVGGDTGVLKRRQGTALKSILAPCA